ncbi:hypothetical protein BD289DRAFT_481018 [Coniella lustricola]|uniref:Uncharacterized protein n=1 Tax=Coniella lustricola TaxID=2025994 RepID=A0A2T3ADK2_9PEZI|nr:hypothetical protein BD289DRAFT_481018 [Coniella lustricola]
MASLRRDGPRLPPRRHTPPRDLIGVKGKLRRRFYEPILLLSAANEACCNKLAPQIEPLADRNNLTTEQLYHNYINKLAQVCDIKSGGSYVTAIAALQRPDGVEYRIASNLRKEIEVVRMKEFVEDLLSTICACTDETTNIVTAKVLSKVILFNKARLRSSYVDRLAEHSSACLNTSDLTPVVREKLTEVQKLATDAKTPDAAAFIHRCFLLMKYIGKLSRSSAYRVFRDKANANPPGVKDCPWRELRHAARRLLSYLEAAQTLVEARFIAGWEPLFYDFTVTAIRSSQAETNPMIAGGSPTASPTAAQILNRMSSSCTPTQLAEHHENANDLQRFDLDLLIQKQCQRPTFCPYVHAEVLVHESIVTDTNPAAGADTLHASKFFGNFRYIGASKPTCRLCEYYFLAVADGIRVRNSHRNLYLNWRAPNVYVDQAPIGGQTAERRREDILNKMTARIRSDAFRTLSDKVAERKKHDSNTSQTYKHGGGSLLNSQPDDDLEDIESTLADTHLYND